AGSQATASDVVGRRALAALTFAPARALRRLDLPTPVPPTSARTYTSLGNRTRSFASARTVFAAAVSIPSESAAAIASSRASRQRARFTRRDPRPRRAGPVRAAAAPALPPPDRRSAFDRARRSPPD